MQRRRPSQEEDRDFKSRVSYLVDESGKTAGWWEANSGGLLARGEVQNWLKHPTRGKRPGVTKAKEAARVFGVHWQWLLDGDRVHGAIFIDDPQESPVEKAVAELTQVVRERLPPTKHPTEDKEPSSDRVATIRPAALAKTTARKRPG